MMKLIERMYSEDHVVGKTGKVFKSLAALSTRSNLDAIEDVMKAKAPTATLEVGLAFGGSALTFAEMHRRNFPAPSRRHVAIDPYQSSIWDNVAEMKLKEAGLKEYVEIYEEPSCIVLPRLLAQGRQFGLIYIDGSHLFEDVFVDGFYGSRLLTENGFLLFDDSTDPHVAKVIAFIGRNLPGLSRQTDQTLRQKVATIVGRRQLTIYQRTGPITRPWDSRFSNF
jgi:predicted O-methyltransferase YrrM